MGTIILHSSLLRDLKAKGEHPLRESNQVRFVASLASSGSSGLILPAFGALVKWPRVLRDHEAIAFFMARFAPDQQPELNPAKQQRPTAWVVACCQLARVGPGCLS